MRGIAAPRTHDLRVLAFCYRETRACIGAEALAELNPYAVQVRYAGDWPEPIISDRTPE
jgi:hypothetical protein